VVISFEIRLKGESMNSKQIRLAREQLDETLKNFDSLKKAAIPPKGWIRAIRDTLGMTGGQLAKRLGVNQQRIARLEHDEKLGKVTLNTMKSTAGALNCVFVYAIVPKGSLEQTVKDQAEKAAKKRMARSDQTMRLEKQELSRQEKTKSLKYLVEDITETMPKSLWDEQ
jgi:predicted DNA-binding mobile mystery protein A